MKTRPANKTQTKTWTPVDIELEGLTSHDFLSSGLDRVTTHTTEIGYLEAVGTYTVRGFRAEAELTMQQLVQLKERIILAAGPNLLSIGMVDYDADMRLHQKLDI